MTSGGYTLASPAVTIRTPLAIEFVRNRARGALSAVLSGFAASNAPWVLVFPADDDYNGPRLNALLHEAEEGYDIVAPSRFMPGGSMQGCPWLKSVLVRSSALFLYHVARLPTRDASNGLRLFSRRVLEADSDSNRREGLRTVLSCSSRHIASAGA